MSELCAHDGLVHVASTWMAKDGTLKAAPYCLYVERCDDIITTAARTGAFRHKRARVKFQVHDEAGIELILDDIASPRVEGTEASCLRCLLVLPRT